MKSIVRNLIALLAFVFVFASCNDDDGPDTSIDAVKTLTFPANNYSVNLLPTGNDLFFEWKDVDEKGMQYLIAFDLPGGDFSNPVYTVSSDNYGNKPSKSFSHRDLNKIARLMGLLSSETGSFKWTIFSVRGLKTMKAATEHTITVRRMDGFDDPPLAVFLTGEATEVGTNPSDALIMQRIEDGVFEIYGQLTAGKSYSFTNGNTASAEKYYLDPVENVLKVDANNVNMTVDKTAVYHIYLDFTTGAAAYREIVKVALFHNSGQINFWLPYKGLGVWGSVINMEYDVVRNNVNIATGTTSNRPNNNPLTGDLDGDERYKFRMVSKSLDGVETVTEWRTVLSNDSPPGNSPNPNWYWMIERTNVEQWTNNQIWKIQTRGWAGYTYDVTFVLKGTEPYTHTLVRTAN